jgi:hypothetical protein
MLEALPDALDREAIRAASREAAEGPAQAVRAFMATMIWGYGRVGYGPWRTRRVLEETPEAPLKLTTAAALVRADGGPVAYRAMTSALRLRFLGPAFGTKYLYFAPSQPDNPPALILDRLVAGWLNRHAGTRINPITWAPSTYKHYVGLLVEFAEELDVGPDAIEERIFIAAAREAGGQWAGS